MGRWFAKGLGICPDELRITTTDFVPDNKLPNELTNPWAVPWLRRLVAGLS
jgi:hypothetical protein